MLLFLVSLNSAEKKVETHGTDDQELSSMKEEILRLKRRISKYELREVELQQESFGEKNNIYIWDTFETYLKCVHLVCDEI